MQLFSRDPAVIEQGVRIAQHLAPFLCLYVCVEILSGTLRGTGDSIVPMIITCGGICLLRVCWVAFVVPHPPRAADGAGQLPRLLGTCVAAVHPVLSVWRLAQTAQKSHGLPT